MTEPESRRFVQLIQARLGGILEELQAHNLIAGEIEWWAAGPPDLLPWAGTFRGPEGIRRWFEALRRAVKYDRFEPLGSSFRRLEESWRSAEETGFYALWAVDHATATAELSPPQLAHQVLAGCERTVPNGYSRAEADENVVHHSEATRCSGRIW